MKTSNLGKLKSDGLRNPQNGTSGNVLNPNVPFGLFIDEEAFVELMKISFQTAQTWRAEGRIGFSQKGKKVYYRLSDIYKFLDHHHRKPFNPGNSYS